MSSFIIPPPPTFVINGDNVEDRFLDYKNKFERFLKGNGLDAKEEGQKVAILKHYCGEDLLMQIEADETEEDTLNDILQRLQDYYTPAANTLQEQFKFFTRRQRANENFDKYLIEMRKIAKNCSFGENEENLMKVVLIMNIKDRDEQQKFLKESDSKKLDTLVPEFRKYDVTKKPFPPRKISQVDSGKNAKQQDAAKKNEQNSQPKPPKQPNQNQNQPQPPKQKQQPPQPQKKIQAAPPQPQKPNPQQNPGKKDSNTPSQPKGNNTPNGEPKKKKKSDRKPNNANPIDVLAEVEQRVKNLCS
uniref:Uncharacterized protein n=1 Tax=Cacopsylla melanoneura TaxID=428564 RepID=A0A8D8VAJ9_9HEMI